MANLPENAGSYLNVFVYGTLRAGESNDIARAAARHRIAEPLRLGQATVRGRLIDFGAYPGLIADPAGMPVLGEVYRIAPALVPVLDEIEEIVPGRAGMFLRRALRVDIEGRQLDAFYYPIDASFAAGGIPTDANDWIAYRKARG